MRLDKKYIEASLKSTGFPLEVATMNILVSLDIDARPSDPYSDVDTGKTREIDIHALDFYPSSEEVFLGNMSKKRRIVVHYIVECKNNSANAWIFFTNATYQNLEPIDFNFKSEKEIYLESNKLEKAVHHFQGGKKLHISFTEIPPKEKSLVYDAISSAVKAVNFYYDKYAAEKILHLFIPVIVLHDNLWSASMSGKSSTSKLKLREECCVIGMHHTIGDKYGGYILYFVVKESYLKKFLLDFRILAKVINSEWAKGNI